MFLATRRRSRQTLAGLRIGQTLPSSATAWAVLWLLSAAAMQAQAQTQGSSQGPAVVVARPAQPLKVESESKIAKQLKQLREEAQQAARELATAEEAVKRAALRLAEAHKKVEEINNKRLAFTRQQAAAQAARLQAAQFTRGVRQEVDVQDATERFLLLTPGGPVVVQAELTVDGKPFRTRREQLIDEMLAHGDQNDDGEVSWAEALKSPRFTHGRLTIYSPQLTPDPRVMFDGNGNGLVERSEARLFLARAFQGPTFNLVQGPAGRQLRLVAVNGRLSMRDSGSPRLQTLLDTDQDGVLSAAEIAAAPKRLKSRDADDNDLLYPAEISGSTSPRQQRRVTDRAPQQPSQPPLAVLLGPTASAESLYNSLLQRYGGKDAQLVEDRFPQARRLFRILDADENGVLETDEVLALNDVQPDVQLTVALTEPDGDATSGVTLAGLAEHLSQVAESPASVSAQRPGARLTFTANSAPYRSYNYARVGESLLNRYDKDSNGYLDEKDELPSSLKQQFMTWDLDRDGKAYPKEIRTAFEMRMAPFESQLRAAVASGSDSVFRALDLTGDGRLSLREMKTAAVQLATLDKDQDGRISAAEVPVFMSVSFSVGRGYSPLRLQAAGRGGARPAPAESVGPAWFTRMDRNGDGDVTFKEFLGTKEQFEKLDTNDDGFVELKEAQAVDKGKSER